MNAVIPIFRIFDEDKMREFYLDYLGFSVLFEHRFDGSLPLYVGVQLAQCELHLSEHHGDATPGSAARFAITDITGYQQGLTAKNYRYYRPALEKQPWGMDMTILDPFGNRLIFSESN